MYTAVMQYNFKKDKLEEASELWAKMVFESAKKQEGLIRLQFYNNEEGKAIALGTWEDKKYAENFMKNGIFKDILEKFAEYLEEQPKHTAYDLKYFFENS